MSAWATTVISGLVLVVAFMQWRTAHQKVVLDLFDRRINIYNRTRDLYRAIYQKGVSLELIEIMSFHQVRGEATFLFGRDVRDFLKRFHEQAIDMAGKYDGSLVAEPEEKRLYIKESHAHLKEIIKLSDELEIVFAPYMRMDQKRVRTPAEWFEDSNRIRLSHADEKQK